MCIVESLLRILDDYMINQLIEDRIANQDGVNTLGAFFFLLFVNAST
ncbi:hypothetical protein [Wolbachia endosymbiont of Dirofilaria (Dirofilaria) immitis]|nr:hypothetical protein [Wolbachia endosymbiont of Dirofilaria (Dirofilaria) immitis]QKX02445.1 hypothetical protein GOY12_02665 [Wolbachia endosymbiont of Dirofilaria (Dirofilaria) immitis]